jgi:hypothetical protein
MKHGPYRDWDSMSYEYICKVVEKDVSKLKRMNGKLLASRDTVPEIRAALAHLEKRRERGLRHEAPKCVHAAFLAERVREYDELKLQMTDKGHVPTKAELAEKKAKASEGDRMTFRERDEMINRSRSFRHWE